METLSDLSVSGNDNPLARAARADEAIAHGNARGPLFIDDELHERAFHHFESVFAARLFLYVGDVSLVGGGVGRVAAVAVAAAHVFLVLSLSHQFMDESALLLRLLEVLIFLCLPSVPQIRPIKLNLERAAPRLDDLVPSPELDGNSPREHELPSQRLGDDVAHEPLQRRYGGHRHAADREVEPHFRHLRELNYRQRVIHQRDVPNPSLDEQRVRGDVHAALEHQPERDLLRVAVERDVRLAHLPPELVLHDLKVPNLRRVGAQVHLFHRRGRDEPRELHAVDLVRDQRPNLVRDFRRDRLLPQRRDGPVHINRSLRRGYRRPLQRGVVHGFQARRRA
eukprot:31562-Pelagococcus_subviridis.AAC.15